MYKKRVLLFRQAGRNASQQFQGG